MSRARQLADLLDSGGDVKTTNLDNTSEYVKPSSEPIGYISGLQGALDGKPDNSQLLTDVPSSAVFTDTVYSKPSSEPISYVDGLQGALDGKQASGSYLTPTGDGSQLTGIDALPTQSSQSGKFLTTNGSAASWGEAGGGATEYLGSISLANQSSFIINNLSASYSRYILKIEGLTFPGSNDSIRWHASDSNGATAWPGYLYKSVGLGYGYGTYMHKFSRYNDDHAQMMYAGGYSTSASNPFQGTFEISGHGTSNSNIAVSATYSYINNQGDFTYFHTEGAIREKNLFNAIRFETNGGSYAGGTVKVYGLKAT
jgi:hypothetical protein